MTCCRARKSWPFVWAFVALVAVVPRPGAAQPVEQARQYEEQARAAYDAEDYERAAGLFARAYGLVPNALTKYNEARAWSAAGRLGAEADAHAAALALGTLDAAFADFSRRRMAELDASLGAVVLTEPAGAKVSVAHANGRMAPCRIHLAAGRYNVRIETPNGGRKTLGVEVVAGRTVQLYLPPEEQPSPATPALGPSSAPDEEGGGGAQSIAGWIGLGTGGALGIVAVVLGVQTLGAVDDFEATNNTDAALRDEAVSLRTWTNVTTIAAALVGGTGIVLLLTAPSEDGGEGDAAALRMGPTLGGMGAAATVRW